MSEIKSKNESITRDVLMYKKRKSDNSELSKTKDNTSFIESPIKRKQPKKRVSYNQKIVDYTYIESYKKYNLDGNADLPEEKKDTIKCHCIVF